MLGVFAEFETNLRRERQMKGIAKAKAAGAGPRPYEIAKALGIGRASVSRVLEAGN